MYGFFMFHRFDVLLKQVFPQQGGLYSTNLLFISRRFFFCFMAVFIKFAVKHLVFVSQLFICASLRGLVFLKSFSASPGAYPKERVSLFKGVFRFFIRFLSCFLLQCLWNFVFGFKSHLRHIWLSILFINISTPHWWPWYWGQPSPGRICTSIYMHVFKVFIEV